jgi:hypothetical protein
MKRIAILTLAATFGVLSFGTSWGLVARLSAQDSGDQHLPADDLTPSEKSRLQSLASGSKATGPQDQALLEKAGRWFVYRATWKKYQEREPTDGATLSTGKTVWEVLQKDLYPLLVVPDPAHPTFKPNDNQVAFMAKFTEALVPPIKKVLKNPRPIARVNAAIILAKLSESGQEALAPLMLEILGDEEQLDAVKFYAVIGLKNIFKGDPFQEIEHRDAFVDKELESKCIQALEKYLLRKPNFDKDVQPAEIDAFRYVRREAMRALGQTKFPAVAKGKVIFAKPALDLLRIVRNDGISPAPTQSEQVEAAIGLCNLQVRQYQGYQLEYVTYQLAQFLVEYGDKYERQRLSPRGLTEPWKYESARLDQALGILGAEATSHAKTKAAALIGHCRDMLKSIVAGVQAAQLREIRDYLTKNPTSETTVYAGLSDSAIQKNEGAGD